MNITTLPEQNGEGRKTGKMSEMSRRGRKFHTNKQLVRKVLEPSAGFGLSAGRLLPSDLIPLPVKQYFLNPLKKFFSVAEIDKVFVNIPVSVLLLKSNYTEVINNNKCFLRSHRIWWKFTRVWWSMCRTPSWTGTLWTSTRSSSATRRGETPLFRYAKIKRATLG